jgi:hypothetical protein
MSESHFTPEIFEQKDVAEKECQKLQALLDQQMPNHSFVFAPEDNEIIIINLLYHEKLKRQRKQIVIHEDDDDDDNENDNDKLKIKPHTFKRHEDDNDEDDDNVNDNDELGDLLDNELLSAFDSQTWEMEPQSLSSQHTEASQHNDNLLVPTTTEPDIPNLYTPQGVGLYFLILSFIYIYFYSKLQSCRSTFDPLGTGRGVVVDWYASIASVPAIRS